MYFLYSVLLTIALAVTAPWWLWAMLRHGKYSSGLSERLGQIPKRLSQKAPGSHDNCTGEDDWAARRCIWIHAVSVGEVMGIEGLATELKDRFPGYRVVVSTTTATGQKLARERFGPDNVFFFPLDFVFAVRPYLQALKPELLVIAETEFWPNLLRLAHGGGARIAVVNARISDRSLPGYRRFRFLMRHVLRGVDLFLAQSSEDAHRLIAIGVPAERVEVSGNLKFDVRTPPGVIFVEDLKQKLRDAAAFPVIVCGSTVEGEESLLLGAFQEVLRQYSKAVMVLAPRRPERFDEVAQLARSIPDAVSWRRSTLNGNEVLHGGILVLDSIGELAAVYSVATVAFVGGSLVPRGGHNILEPAGFGVPILVGNHTENFRDIIHNFQDQDAVRVVQKDDVAATLLALVADQAERELLGRRARDTLRLHAGATTRTADALQRLMNTGQRLPVVVEGKAIP